MERSPVYEFDYNADPALTVDCHARYWQMMQDAPKVFWTNANGGHWVANSTASITRVLRHPEIFSSCYQSIPPNAAQPKMIPESLDPPEHKQFRQMLRPFFESKAIMPLAKRIEEWTNELLDQVADQGQCEFVEAIASRLPVGVFMELFGFPMEKFDEFRRLELAFFDVRTPLEERTAATMTILGHIGELIQARTAVPQDDMISKIIGSKVDGRDMTFDELMSIGFLMFLAGLDTVTNAMSFGMRHLAHDAALRQRVIDDPALIPDMIEELLRRYAFVSTPRTLTQDTVLEGVALKTGEQIYAPLPIIGWDERLNRDPATVSVDRDYYRHAAFGSGVHTCIGLHLARLELAIFYRSWFTRIGHFRQVQRGDEACRAGPVLGLERLHLEWENR